MRCPVVGLVEDLCVEYDIIGAYGIEPDDDDEFL